MKVTELAIRKTDPRAEALFERELERWRPLRDRKFEWDPYDASWLVDMRYVLQSDIAALPEEAANKVKRRLLDSLEHLIAIGTTVPEIHKWRMEVFWEVNDPDRAMKRLDDLQAAVLYSNFSTKYLEMAARRADMTDTNSRNGPGQTLNAEERAELDCRIAQIAMVFRTVCTAGATPGDCDPEHGGYLVAVRQLERIAAENLCPAITELSPGEVMSSWPGFDPEVYQQRETLAYTNTRPLVARISGWGEHLEGDPKEAMERAMKELEESRKQ